ncbi:MAG: hypothetical protein KH425_09900, partial [Prevotella bivia]|nr:hypothetical protein [Prevotella bivia]
MFTVKVSDEGKFVGEIALTWLYILASNSTIQVLSLKVCKLFFSFILVISIFLYFLPTFELVYF